MPRITPFCSSRLFVALMVVSPLAFLSSVASATDINNARIGDAFSLNLDTVCQERGLLAQKEGQLKLVVFMPEKSEYESMLELAFTNYFKHQYAFSAPLENQEIQTIYIKSSPQVSKVIPQENSVKEAPGPASISLPSSLFMMGSEGKQAGTINADCNFPEDRIVDIEKQIAEQLQMNFPKKDNTSATVFLLDEKNVIQWRDDNYQSQGEHLKPLEKKVKQLLGVTDPEVVKDLSVKPLQLGDQAPDFLIDDTRRLSGLKGKTTLITFYPAAFSGTLSVSTRGCPMCCSYQITSLAESQGISEFSPKNELPVSSPEDSPVQRIAISSSTPRLLNAWEAVLKTYNKISFVNDVDYSIAQSYGSYDREKGYDRRTVFIVDRDGKIAFVDHDYTREDTDTVRQALEKISQDNGT